MLGYDQGTPSSIEGQKHLCQSFPLTLFVCAGTHLHELFAVRAAMFPEVGGCLDNRAQEARAELFCARLGGNRCVNLRHGETLRWTRSEWKEQPQAALAVLHGEERSFGNVRHGRLCIPDVAVADDGEQDHSDHHGRPCPHSPLRTSARGGVGVLSYPPCSSLVVSPVCCPALQPRRSLRYMLCSSKALSSSAAAQGHKTDSHTLASALYNHDNICEHDAVVVIDHAGVRLLLQAPCRPALIRSGHLASRVGPTCSRALLPCGEVPLQRAVLVEVRVC